MWLKFTETCKMWYPEPNLRLLDIDTLRGLTEIMSILEDLICETHIVDVP